MATKANPFKSEVAPEHSFAELTHLLVEAESKSKAASSDAGVARGEKSNVAISTIKSALIEATNVEFFRDTLLTAGVLKGTVSKMATILNAVRDGIINFSDLKSLNGSYVLIKATIAEKEAAVVALMGPASFLPGLAPVAPVVTPEDALALIVKVITDEKDPDKAYALGSEWLTKITNALTTAISAIGDGEEGE